MSNLIKQLSNAVRFLSIDAVEKAKVNLPQDLPQESDIYEISFSDFPVMSVTLSGSYSI